MGQGDAGARCSPERCRNTGHHLERNVHGRELFGFLAATAEDERIAALQANNFLAFQRTRDDDRMYTRLVMTAAVRSPPYRDEFRARRRHCKNCRRYELVERHDSGPPKEPVRTDREEVRVAGTGPDQPHLPSTDAAYSIGWTVHNSSTPQRRAIARSTGENSTASLVRPRATITTTTASTSAVSPRSRPVSRS